MDFAWRPDNEIEVITEVPVLLWRGLIAFGLEQFERADQFGRVNRG